ncbi:MAG: hypothetical protein AAFR52_05950, partial [Pseudomonadota bacterium]
MSRRIKTNITIMPGCKRPTTQGDTSFLSSSRRAAQQPAWQRGPAETAEEGEPMDIHEYQAKE